MFVAIASAVKLKKKAIKYVIVVFPTEALLNQDRNAWDQLKLTYGDALTLKTVVGLEKAKDIIQSPPHTIVLIDEADYELIDRMQDLPKSVFATIAMSATNPNSSYGYVKKRLHELSMKSIDSKIPSIIHEDILVAPISFDAYLHADPGMAKLIYCDKVMISEIEAKVGKGLFVVNEDNPANYRNLTHTSVVIVTKEELMRGIDYKCATGISLLIAKTLSNPRIYLQCLGRVCRWTDAGKRYILRGIWKHLTE